MFSREEKKDLNTSFSNYLLNVCRGIKVWVGRNSLGNLQDWRSRYFLSTTDVSEVGLAIDLQFKDAEIRALFYDQFEEFNHA